MVGRGHLGSLDPGTQRNGAGVVVVSLGHLGSVDPMKHRGGG